MATKELDEAVRQAAENGRHMLVELEDGTRAVVISEREEIRRIAEGATSWPSGWVVALVGVGAYVALAATVWFDHFPGEPEFGDAFGFLAFLVSAAALWQVAEGLKMQREELGLQRAELRATRQEMALQRVASEQSASVQGVSSAVAVVEQWLQLAHTLGLLQGVRINGSFNADEVVPHLLALSEHAPPASSRHLVERVFDTVTRYIKGQIREGKAKRTPYNPQRLSQHLSEVEEAWNRLYP